jgi:hypothetical protein
MWAKVLKDIIPITKATIHPVAFVMPVVLYGRG